MKVDIKCGVSQEAMELVWEKSPDAVIDKRQADENVGLRYVHAYFWQMVRALDCWTHVSTFIAMPNRRLPREIHKPQAVRLPIGLAWLCLCLVGWLCLCFRSVGFSSHQ